MRLPLVLLNLRGWLLKHVWSKENRWALAFFLIIVLVIVLTADNTPLWIYQGF